MNRRAFIRGFSSWLILSNAPRAAGIESGVTASRRRIRFELAVENRLSRVLTNQELYLYMPIAMTNSQKLVASVIDRAYTKLQDEVGNSICRLGFAELAPYSTEIVKFSFELEMADAKKVDVPSVGRFLSAEKYIESDDPNIVGLAKELATSSSSETIAAIYKWIGSNLHSTAYIADDMGAQWALQNRRGDCSEYAYLTVALCRANGIPARVIGGYVVERDKVIHSGDYHNWAEAYVDGAWKLVDAQRGVIFAGSDSYAAFEYVSNSVVNPLAGAHRFVARGGCVAHMT